MQINPACVDTIYLEMQIRALEHNITKAFERAVGVGLPQTISSGTVRREIDFLIDEVPLRTPYADANTGKIAVQETYLSYIWAVFYALLVIQEEGITKALQARTFSGHVLFNTPTLIESRHLFQWALALRHSFVPWPGHLPNPSTCQSVGPSADYAGKVNALFIGATSYVLCHEYAHLINQHAQTIAKLRTIPARVRSDADRALGKQIETEADTFARGCMQTSTDATGGTTQSAIAAVMLHCADMLSFLNPIDLKQSLHPDVDQRLLNSIHFAAPAGHAENFLWGTACFTARKFFDLHRLAVFEPGRISSMQELFEYYLTVFDTLKSSQIL
jgi:hypothetical protein